MATLVQRILDLTTRIATEFKSVRSEFAAGLAAVSGGNIANVTGLVSGGGVVNTAAYSFTVAAASYYIAGTLYSSAQQSITLDPADATFDRIDVLALDDTGTLVKITGTPAAAPSQPDIDPSTQLRLTFIIVPAGTTAPVGVTTETIYDEGGEWTASTSGVGFTVGSTNSAYSGTHSVEATNLGNGAYAQFQRATSEKLDAATNLVFYIRSKAAWANKRTLRIQWFSAGVAKGQAKTLQTGAYGFDSSLTGSYQLVVVPISDFALPAGTDLNQIRFTDSGGAIGFFIDKIGIQSFGSSAGGPTASGITQDQADARYAQRANNLSDLTDAYAALQALGLAQLVAASEALAAGDQVNLHSVGGALRMRKTSATDTSKPSDGFVRQAVASGATGWLYPPGAVNDALVGLTPGATYYLSTVGGGITNAIPAASGNGQQEVGKAISATKLRYSPKIMLEAP